MVLQLTSVAVFLVPWYLLAQKRLQAGITWGAAAVLPVSAILAFGIPAPGTLRANIEELAGGIGEDVIRGDASFVAGNYWKVWPAVVHANILRYDRGDSRPVWGLANKADPLLTALPSLSPGMMRVAVIQGEFKEAHPWIRRLRLPVNLQAAYSGKSAFIMAPELQSFTAADALESRGPGS